METISTQEGERHENIVFAASASQVEASSRLEGNVTNNRVADQLSMSESEWTVKQMLKRPVRIDTATWHTTDTRKYNGPTYKLPGFLVNLTTSPIYALLSSFVYYRTDFIIRFELASSKFNVGKFMPVFLPADKYEHSGSSLDRFSMEELSGYPHVQLDASQSTIGTLRVPYASIQNYLTTTTNQGFDSLGTIAMTVLNPLKVPNGAPTSVSIVVWLYAEEPSLHVPVPNHLPRFGVAQMLNVSAAVKEAEQIITPLMDSMQIAGSIVGTNRDMPTDPLPNDNRSVGPQSNSVGIWNGVRLALSPNTQTFTEASISGSSIDEMLIKNIISIPTLLDTFAWKISDPINAGLSFYEITPMTARVRQSDVTQRNNSFLSFVATPFIYWRGGITYTIDVVASMFHTGRLICSFVPLWETDPIDADLNQYPSITIDLALMRTVTFTVPHDASLTWKLTTNTSVRTPRHSNGRLYINVLAELNAPSSVPGDVEVNVWVSGAPDMEFNSLYDNDLVFKGAGDEQLRPGDPKFWNANDLPQSETYLIPRLAEAQMQSDIITPDFTRARPPTQNVLHHGSQMISGAAHITQSESVSTIKDCIRRHHHLMFLDRRIGLPDRGFFGLDIRVAPNQIDNTNITHKTAYGGLVDYFANIYAFWRGSMRYDFIGNYNKNQTALHMVRHMPHIWLRNNSIYGQNGISEVGPLFTATDFQNVSHTPTFSVEAPFNTVHNWLLTSVPANDVDAIFHDNGTLRYTLFMGAPTVAQTADGPVPDSRVVYVNMEVTVAAGDDFVFSYLIGPPASWVRYGVGNYIFWYSPASLL
jgi:hypothetical protein